MKGKNTWRKGKPSPMNSKKHTEKTKLKISRSRTGKCLGEANGSYLKDRSMLSNKQERNDYAYQDWRRQVYTRDKFRCKLHNGDCYGGIEAHHILGWSSHPELRYQVNNGIILCHFHHPRKRVDERKLISFFMDLIKEELI